MLIILASQGDSDPSNINHKIHKILFFLTSLKKGSNKTFILAGLSILLATSCLQGQVLKDSASVRLIKKGIDYVYNFEFNNARRISEELRNKYPGHPLNYFYKGMITYWENYPLVTNSPARKSFEEDMRKCIGLCDDKKDTANESETLLINLCARGLLLLFYTDNDLSLEVFPIAASTYDCIRRSFNYTGHYSDFYFFTGVYKYYREAYPEAHPVYKTLAFLFPRGSKSEGIKELVSVANNSIMLKAEAYTFLTEIYLSFENNYQKAAYYSKGLHYIYPDNPEYLGSYILNLLLIKQYDQAEKEILSSDSGDKNPYFQAQVTIFNGIVQEKKYHDTKKAQQFYEKGIKDMSVFRSYGYEYSAYAYFGLSRISEMNGDSNNQKLYRRLALKLAYFKNIDFD